MGGCATNSIDDVLSFSISRPKQCNKSGSHGSSPSRMKRSQLSDVAYDAGLQGVDSKDGSFVRTCPADEMREKMREKREEWKEKKNKKKDEEEHPQGYLDEEFDYDVVTTYAKSDKCTGKAIRMERRRTHCKQITAKDLWWNWMRKRTNTCDATSVFVSDYCGSTLPEPVLRKERFDRMRREERERMEKERKDKKNKGEDNKPEQEESEVGESSSSSSSSTASNSAGTAVIIGSIVGSLAAIAMIAIGLHMYKT